MKRLLYLTALALSLLMVIYGLEELIIYYENSTRYKHEMVRLADNITQNLATPYDMYKELFMQNDDMIGWLQIEGTILNYPVMQTPNCPNFYLKRNYDKEESQYGALFVAEKCCIYPQSDNIIIYGHNMEDGQMFGSLDEYLSKSYYDSHPMIRFNTLKDFGEYHIVSVFRTVLSKFQYFSFIDAKTQDEFDSFMSECHKYAIYDTGETAKYGDKLLTLSTCDYLGHDSRLVVVAKKI